MGKEATLEIPMQFFEIICLALAHYATVASYVAQSAAARGAFDKLIEIATKKE